MTKSTVPTARVSHQIVNSRGVPIQGRNEVYGIRDQRPKKGWDQGSQPRIRDQSPRDRDQRVFHGLKDQASRFCGIRDQNFHHFWDQGLKICVKIRDQRRKNIPRYDPDQLLHENLLTHARARLSSLFTADAAFFDKS